MNYILYGGLPLKIGNIFDKENYFKVTLENQRKITELTNPEKYKTWDLILLKLLKVSSRIRNEFWKTYKHYKTKFL